MSPAQEAVLATASRVAAAAASGSLVELAAVLTGRAALTAGEGNYAIAAALVVPCDGAELVVFGENTMFTEHDAMGHAEAGALRRAQTLLGADSADWARTWTAQAALDLDHFAFVRPTTAPISERPWLLTTLEPCPMCSVAILNFGLTKVVSLAEDTTAGTMLGGRLARLGPVWEAIAADRHLEPSLAAPDLPPELVAALDGVFTDSRADNDADLGTGGLVSDEQLVELARSMRAMKSLPTTARADGTGTPG